MLAQYAQVMGIKAAQQEMEGSEDVRRYFSSPADQRGDISKIMHTKGGRAASETLSQNAQRDLKMQIDALGAAKANVYMAKDPAALAEYIKGVYSSPAGKLLSTFVPVDKALAAIPTDPVAFKQYQENFGLTADQIVTNVTKKRGQNMTYGATVRGQNMTDARAREQMAFERDKRSVREAADGFVQQDAFGNLYRVEGYGALRGPNAPAPAMPQAAANAFVTTQPSVNALAPTAPPVVQPGSPTRANAAAVAAQDNVPRPKVPVRQPVLTEVDDPATPGQKLRVDANVYQQGTTLGAPGVFGVARTENLTPPQKQKLKGEISKDFEALQRVVGQTNELLESIDAVRSSSLEKVAGPVDARTPSLFKEAQVADARFNNLKGKVTAIAKANASLGGAIGSIANQEWQILANQIAVLDLAGGKTANLEQIEQLERQAMSIVARMRDGFERQYGADVETLAPQYKDVPNVNYTPGQYTATGKKNSSVDSTNPWLK
jgi:hypothetical protein